MIGRDSKGETRSTWAWNWGLGAGQIFGGCGPDSERSAVGGRANAAEPFGLPVGQCQGSVGQGFRGNGVDSRLVHCSHSSARHENREVARSAKCEVRGAVTGPGWKR